jgi:hypothetical protein
LYLPYRVDILTSMCVLRVFVRGKNKRRRELEKSLGNVSRKKKRELLSLFVYL